MLLVPVWATNELCSMSCGHTPSNSSTSQTQTGQTTHKTSFMPPDTQQHKAAQKHFVNTRTTPHEQGPCVWVWLPYAAQVCSAGHGCVRVCGGTHIHVAGRGTMPLNRHAGTPLPAHTLAAALNTTADNALHNLLCPCRQTVARGGGGGTHAPVSLCNHTQTQQRHIKTKGNLHCCH